MSILSTARPRHAPRQRRTRPFILSQIIRSPRPERRWRKWPLHARLPPQTDANPRTCACLANSTPPRLSPRGAPSSTHAHTSRTGRCQPQVPSVRSTRAPSRPPSPPRRTRRTSWLPSAARGSRTTSTAASTQRLCAAYLRGGQLLVSLFSDPSLP